jgi:predicted outer membrane repeat protein
LEGGASLSDSESIYKDNAAISGGVYNFVDSTAILDTVTVENNLALYGGAIYALDACDIQVSKSKFVHNTARVSGGTIVIQQSSLNRVEKACLISQSEISHSNAGNEGGTKIVGTFS